MNLQRAVRVIDAFAPGKIHTIIVRDLPTIELTRKQAAANLLKNCLIGEYTSEDSLAFDFLMSCAEGGSHE